MKLYKEFKISGIYCIKNLINSKVYIGSAVNIYNRINHHRWQLKNKCHHSEHLQKAYNKYGYNNFEVIILACVFDINQLIVLEQNFIDEYKSYDNKFGYNISKIAGRIEHTNIVRQKISESQLGYKNHRYNKKWSNEYKILFRALNAGNNNGFYGKKHSQESKKKMSISHKNRSVETIIKSRNRYRRKPFVCLQNNKIYTSTGDAARDLNINVKNISTCLNNKRKSCFGYSFVYLNQENKNASKI